MAGTAPDANAERQAVTYREPCMGVAGRGDLPGDGGARNQNTRVLSSVASEDQSKRASSAAAVSEWSRQKTMVVVNDVGGQWSWREKL